MRGSGTEWRRRVDALLDHFKRHEHLFKKIVGEMNAAFENSQELSPLIHSLKWRIKDSERLKEKLERKSEAAFKNGKEVRITPEKLFVKINDLVGFRLIHLHTRQIESINPALIRSLSDSYRLHEGPIAKT